MYSAIQCVRYVLKELMMQHGEDHVLSILNHGTPIKLKPPAPEVENTPLLDGESVEFLFEENYFKEEDQ